MVLAQEAFLSVVKVVDQNKNPASGKTISYIIYDENQVSWQTGSMDEITGTGTYYKFWTPDEDGYWIFEAFYVGSDFKFYGIKMYQVGLGVEDAIFERIGAPAFSTIAGDIANLITRAKGLDEIHDDLAVVDGIVDAILVDTNNLTLNLAVVDQNVDDLKDALIAYEGTTTGDGADPSKIIDSALTQGDDYWNGATVVIVDGVCAGQQREITDFDALNDEITVNPLFDNVIVTGVEYKIINVRSAEAAIADLITRAKGLDAIYDNIGDFAGQTNLQTLLATLGIPDVAAKPLYTVLVTDLLAHGTHGLAALKTLIDLIQTDLGDWSSYANFASLLAALGIPDVAGKDLYTLLVTDRLDNATYGLNALKTLIDNLNADLGNFSGRTTLQSLLAILGWVDNPASQTLEQRLGTGYQLAGSIEADIAAVAAIGADIENALIGAEGTTDGNGNVGGTTIIDSGLAEANDYWNGATLVIEDGACAGQEREITDFAGGTLTVSPAFAAQVVTGVHYYIIHVRSAEAAIADLDADLVQHDTDIKADLGDFSGQTNLQSLLAVLGVPDVAGKDLYTCLITDRLDNATYGLAALETLVDDIENMLKAAPSVDSILFKSGGAVCPAGKSIWDALGDGTVDLNALSIAIAAIQTDLGDWSGYTNFASLLAALGIPDVAGKDLYTVLVTDLLAHGTHGLAAIEALVDDLETWLGDPSGDTLATITAKFGDLTESLTTILETFVSSPSGGLGDRIAFIQSLIQTNSTVNGAAGTVDLFDTNLTETTDDHYNNHVLMFTGGALAGQSRLIIDYDGTTKEVTVHPSLTEAPADTDAFVIFTGGYQGALRTGSKGLQQIFDLVDQLFNLHRVGDTVTTDGTEQTIFIVDNPDFPFRPDKFLIDGTNNAAGETVEIKCYYRLKEGGNYILESTTTMMNDISPDIVVIDLQPNTFGIKITIEKTAGVNRDYDYEVYDEEK